MFYKRLICFTLTALMSITLISCNKSIHKNTLEQVMGFLTSEECDGRFPGTPGNKKAEEYIEDCFEKIGLDKYNGSYKFEYTHKYLKPIGEDYKLAFTFSNGEVLECKYGKDFFTNTIGNFDLQYRLTFDENDNDINNSVIAIDSDKTSLKNIVNKSKPIILHFRLQLKKKMVFH